ncbi:hypothetical protein [Neorhizobium sp. NCHU2750]|uniref:hypothetical protein n=1 Tax=Neorhizobium sp. NCHU2750 TaxID=1825976 RepID=UPI000E71F5A3|nr:hypothetical protein NCHU2750_25290 [Neorhizobium sp. NCHU2750]
MKKIIALAAMISASTFAAGAYAQDTGITAPAPSMSDVNVVNVSNPPATGNGSTPPADVTSPAPEVIQTAQAEVQSDPALMQVLSDRSIALQNVVAVRTAGDGGKTIYIK